MTEPVRCLAFDVDGVLYTSEPFIAQAYQEAVLGIRLPYPAPSLPLILDQIGKPMHEIFISLFPVITPEEEGRLGDAVKDSIARMILEGRGEIYPGIPEAVAALSRQARLVTCSNGRRYYVESILSYYGLARYFGPVLTLEDLRLDHKGELLKAQIDRSGIPVSGWTMVGDRKSDLLAARFAGCRFVACLWGHADPSETAGADLVLQDPSELLALA